MGAPVFKKKHLKKSKFLVVLIFIQLLNGKLTPKIKPKLYNPFCKILIYLIYLKLDLQLFYRIF